MTAPALPLIDFAVLDGLIVGALNDLRRARSASTRAGTQEVMAVQDRAEEHLNALLEYRYAARHRPSPDACP